MKIEAKGDTLRITEVPELVAASSGQFRRDVLAALADSHRNFDVDLSDTTFLDSSGLGALIGLYRTATSRSGVVRLLSPRPPIMQVLELTRMKNVFEISPLQPATLERTALP